MSLPDRPFDPSHLSRRHVVAGLTGTLILPTPLYAVALPLTPPQTAGPFYPAATDRPADMDADLVVNRDKATRATGQIIYVTGRVKLADGRPVERARVEIWQADAEGVYNHPRDRGSTLFQGFGVATTDAQGRYRFRTIKPAEYGSFFFRRTPHIHFRVEGPGAETLVTQMYFAGEPRNETDGILNRIEDEAARVRLIVELQPAPDIEPEAHVGMFDIVLPPARRGTG